MASHASLARYRPVILTIAVIAAALGVVVVGTQLLSSHPRQPLRRSNAVHGRRPRQRARDSHESHESHESNEARESRSAMTLWAGDLDRSGTRGISVRLPRGETAPLEVLLAEDTLPSADVLREQLVLDAQEAKDVRHQLELLLLNALLSEGYGRSSFQHADPDFGRARAWLIYLGAREEDVDIHLAAFNDAVAIHDDGSAVVDRATMQLLARDTQVDNQTEAEDGQAGQRSSGVIQAEGQKLYTLLFHIAEERDRNEGYIHRGVTCNSCSTIPIRGIRYRCANCPDFDLCEYCEAQGQHQRTHLFYKVRIPAPFLGNPRQSQPVIYPGKRDRMPEMLDLELRDRLASELHSDTSELDGLYDQFGCLARSEWPSDPNKIGWAIDQKTFYKCFIPNSSIRSPKPNLIYDRLFSFYDTDRDGLIGFEEFARSVACISNKTKDEKLKRVFNAFDLDEDGFVDRKDFLRMFRAYYALTRDLTRDVVAGWEDEATDLDETQRVVMSGGPLTAAFRTSTPLIEESRAGQGKHLDEYGDMVLNEGEKDRAIVENGTGCADRNEILAELYDPPLDVILAVPEPDVEVIVDQVLQAVVARAMNMGSAEEMPDAAAEATDQDDVEPERAGNELLKEHWRRKEFYVDEEEGFTAPEGLLENHSPEDSDGDEDDKQEPMGDLAPSPRSRSSSKVRFQDETDIFETRSNASTSSRPINERWGGYEIPEAEKDIGREILYQVTQQGLNEMLDPIFKVKEDLAMEVRATKEEREKWAEEMVQYGKKLEDEARLSQDPLVATAMALEAQRVASPPFSDEAPQVLEPSIVRQPLEELLHVSGYGTVHQIGEPAETLTPAQTHEDVPSKDGLSDPYQHLDPTMPQNKPNVIPQPTPSTSHFPEESSSSTQNATAEELPPPTARLAHLLALNAAEAEIGARGKAGTLDFDEFAAAMRDGAGDGGGRRKDVFGVVSSWIEIGSF